MRCELPSGLVLEVRKMKGSEMVALAENAAGAGASNPFGSILGPCAIDVLEAGPYPHLTPGAGKPHNWDRIMKGDLLAGVLFLRRVSMEEGDQYDFSLRCEECEEPINWTLALSKLPVRRLSDVAFAKHKAGEPMEVRLSTESHPAREDGSGGILCRFLPGIPKQEEEVRDLNKKERPPRRKVTDVDLLAAQTVSIGDMSDPKNLITAGFARRQFFSSLSWGEVLMARRLYDEHDCGIDTALDVVCQACGWRQTTTVPFGRTLFRARPAWAVKTTTPQDAEQTIVDPAS